MNIVPESAVQEILTERICSLIAEQLGISGEDVGPKTRFIDDLGIDLMDVAELVISLEEQIPNLRIEEDGSQLDCVGDIIRLLGQ